MFLPLSPPSVVFLWCGNVNQNVNLLQDFDGFQLSWDSSSTAARLFLCGLFFLGLSSIWYSPLCHWTSHLQMYTVYGVVFRCKNIIAENFVDRHTVDEVQKWFCRKCTRCTIDHLARCMGLVITYQKRRVHVGCVTRHVPASKGASSVHWRRSIYVSGQPPAKSRYFAPVGDGAKSTISAYAETTRVNRTRPLTWEFLAAQDTSGRRVVWLGVVLMFGWYDLWENKFSCCVRCSISTLERIIESHNANPRRVKSRPNTSHTWLNHTHRLEQKIQFCISTKWNHVCVLFDLSPEQF